MEVGSVLTLEGLNIVKGYSTDYKFKKYTRKAKRDIAFNNYMELCNRLKLTPEFNFIHSIITPIIFRITNSQSPMKVRYERQHTILTKIKNKMIIIRTPFITKGKIFEIVTI